jgi:hypothetical protein
MLTLTPLSRTSSYLVVGVRENRPNDCLDQAEITTNLLRGQSLASIDSLAMVE